VNREGDIFEQVRLFLPKYLTPAQSDQLWSELSALPYIKNFYLPESESPPELLQGDGWRGFVVIEFYTGDRKDVAGVILSNSCDLQPHNRREPRRNILFAPLIELERYRERLLEAGKTLDQVEDIFRTIREQKITEIFYLPELPGSLPESMALLNDIHTHPAEDFLARTRKRLFTLGQTAFYLFLMKLSIHFSRFQEDVPRFEGNA